MLKNESTSTPEKRIQGKKKRPIEQHQDGAKRAKVEERNQISLIDIQIQHP